MNIVFDLSPFLYPITGVGKYTFELYSRFLVNNICFLYVNVLLRNNIKQDFFLHNSQNKSLRKLKKITCSLFQKRNKDSIFHSPSFEVNSNFKKSICTIHNLSVFFQSHYYSFKRRVFLKNVIKNLIKRADHFIVSSNFTKNELMDKFSLNENQVSRIYLSVNKPEISFIPNSKFILFIGKLEPRKRVDLLINSYLKLLKNLQKDFPLIIAGSSGLNSSDGTKQLSKL